MIILPDLDKVNDNFAMLMCNFLLKDCMAESVIGGRWVFFFTKCWSATHRSILKVLLALMERLWIIKIPSHFRTMWKLVKQPSTYFVPFSLTGT